MRPQVRGLRGRRMAANSRAIDAPAGARAEDDPLLLQGGMQAPFPESGVCLQLLGGRDRAQRHQAGAVGAGVGFRRESRHALLDPAPQRPVDGRAADVQIARDARGIPALEM